jgi:hypothetical protein
VIRKNHPFFYRRSAILRPGNSANAAVSLRTGNGGEGLRVIVRFKTALEVSGDRAT